MLSKNPLLNIQDIEDPVVRRNFEQLLTYFRSQNQLLDFQFFEQVFEEAETDRVVRHSLGYIPRDVLVSRLTGEGTIRFNLGRFTEDELLLTATGPCRVRFYVGAKDLSEDEPAQDEYQEFSAVGGGGEQGPPGPSGQDGADGDDGADGADGSDAPPPSFTTKTTTYTVTASDDSVAGNATGGAFTLTLPTAVGNDGKIFRLGKTDSSTNAVTVDGNGSETIRGQTTFRLSTQHEWITIQSDGANWVLLQHEYPKVETSYSPTLVGFGTPSSVQFQWSRIGDKARIQGKFTSGTSTATEARFPLPTGLVSAGTSKIPSIMIVGEFADNEASSSFNRHALAEPSVTYLTVSSQGNATNGLTKNTGSGYLSSGSTASFFAMVPIDGWEG